MALFCFRRGRKACHLKESCRDWVKNSTTNHSMRTLPAYSHNARKTPKQKRKLFGVKLNFKMKKQVIYGYIGLMILTAVSFINYYIIQHQDEASLEREYYLVYSRQRRDARDIPPPEYHFEIKDYRKIEPIQEPKYNAQEYNGPENNAPENDVARKELDDIRNENIEPVKNIYYVKVHKAGSTTLQNIMFRFALKHNLRVAIFNRQWGMPYPEYAKPEFLYENMTDPEFKKYNMICDHTVYDRATVDPYMANGYESIAILREPYSHLVSAFDFWGLAKRFRLHKARDPLRVFLTNNPDQYRNITPHFNRTKNMQAYHFGHIDYHDNSEESMDKLIKHIEQHFKLVMLRERFEESLILMRRIFKWKFEDILYMDQFVNTQPKAKMRTDKEDDHLRNKHREFAPVDYRLYDHFSKKLNTMIDNEPNDLLGEVLYFKETNRKVAEFCENVCALFPLDSIKNLTVEDILPRLEEGIVIPATKWHSEIKITYANCAYMKFWTYQYHNAFRVQQLPASCPESKGIGPAVSNAIFDPHDIIKYGYCDTKNRVLFNFPLDVFKEIVLDVPMHPVTNAKIAKAPKCKRRES